MHVGDAGRGKVEGLSYVYCDRAPFAVAAVYLPVSMPLNCDVVFEYQV